LEACHHDKEKKQHLVNVNTDNFDKNHSNPTLCSHRIADHPIVPYLPTMVWIICTFSSS
jgi:hypothetical protein